MIKERDKRIDILRSIALIGIIIAHVSPPDFLVQFRNFDVPLMALLMGTSFYLSNQNKIIKKSDYFIRRTKRLLFPTWIFLTIFFVLFFFLSLFLGDKYYFNLDTIILSYSLVTGIGFVWIIGVFIAIALLNPFILKFSEKINKNINYFLIITIVYMIYLILIQVTRYLDGNIALLYEHYVLYTIGYGMVAAIGIRLKKLTNKEIKILIALFMMIFVVLMFENNFAFTSTAKYPPTMYYLSYALGISFILYLLLENRIVFKLFDNKYIYFISKNSLWFYLWHIIPIYAIRGLDESIPILADSSLIRFILVLVITWFLTYYQNFIQLKILNKSTIASKR